MNCFSCNKLIYDRGPQTNKIGLACLICENSCAMWIHYSDYSCFRSLAFRLTGIETVVSNMRSKKFKTITDLELGKLSLFKCQCGADLKGFGEPDSFGLPPSDDWLCIIRTTRYKEVCRTSIRKLLNKIVRTLWLVHNTNPCAQKSDLLDVFKKLRKIRLDSLQNDPDCLHYFGRYRYIDTVWVSELIKLKLFRIKVMTEIKKNITPEIARLVKETI